MEVSPTELHTNAAALAAGKLSEADLAWWLGSIIHPREALAQRAANAYT